MIIIKIAILVVLLHVLKIPGRVFDTDDVGKGMRELSDRCRRNRVSGAGRNIIYDDRQIHRLRNGGIMIINLVLIRRGKIRTYDTEDIRSQFFGFSA